ncbi:BIG GRAIN 1-like protein A [Tanacetum coccineum]
MNSRRFPSFSSSLLDEIYKSFEDDHKKPVVARRSTAEIESRHERDVSRSCHVNYSSYSSCSSNENDTMYGVLKKPKHIRTCVGQHGEFIKPRDSVSDVSEQKPNHVDEFRGLVWTKFEVGEHPRVLSTSSAFPKKSLYEDKTRLKSVKHDKNSINEEIKGSLSEDNRRISEAARNLLKNYRKKVECEFDSIMSKEYGEISYDYMSDSSSDLFELDNLKYREELPVYETTHLDTNRAIANGLVV